jgi:AraC-like DNA-binding protein
MLLDELCALLARHARADTTTAIEDLLIGREEADTTLPPAAPTRMTLIAQGSKRLVHGEHVRNLQAGEYLVSTIAVPLKCRFIDATPQRPVLGLCLILRSSDVAEMILQAPPGAFTRDKTTTPPAVAFGTASESLLDAVVRLVRLLDKPRDIDTLAPLIKREILWRLITSEHGATVRQIAFTDSRLSPIAAAVRWIRDNYKEPFQVEDLAALTGMSISAFYRNFRSVTGTTPIQYQKKIRLQEARLLLAANPKDVTRIGYLVGYDSPSQFSREYRRHFGASPSQDAIQLATGINDAKN